MNQLRTVVGSSPMARASAVMLPQMEMNDCLSMQHNMNCEGAQVNTSCVATVAKKRRMEMHERLKKAREQAGFETATDAARKFGWTVTTYRAHENGQRNIPRETAPAYARAFRVSPEWLLFGRGTAGKKPVPLVGFVGAGAEVFPIDDGGALDEIEPPPGIGPNAVAVQVRGDSMYPRYMEGDTLIYDAHVPLEKADGQECVVALRDGRRFVKIVRVSGETVSLESFNAPPIRDQEVEWAGPVLWVKRRA